MADKTGIEWTDATWNPVVGCDVVSPGCTNCYAMKMAARIEAMQPGSHYAGTTMPTKAGALWTGKVALAPDHILTQPLRWRKPRKIFVNSMGDLFHESVPDEWIDRVFAVMVLALQHTFQVLTKRPARMRDYIGRIGEPRRQRNEAIRAAMDDILPGHMRPWALHPSNPHIWLGISAEDQRRYDERRDDILELAGGFPLFVSAEPLLGKLYLGFQRDHCELCGGTGALARWPKGKCHVCGGKGTVLVNGGRLPNSYAAFSCVIVGGESGPRARPMHPDWARSIRDQCAAAGVPFFFKQWGEWSALVDRDRDDDDWRLDYGRKYRDWGNTKWLNLAGGSGFHGERFHVMGRVGKRAAGRLLDGVEHNGMPGDRA